MASSVDELKARLEDLQRQAARVDVAAARAWLAKAERAFAEVKAGPRLPNVNDDQARYGAAAQNERQARKELAETVARDAGLRRDIEHLSSMVFAQERIEQAKASAATIAEVVTSAATAVHAARDTVAKIDDMIRAEQKAFELARGSAATNLLATLKAGGDAASIQTPNLDKVATLELAKVEAEQELLAAEAALQAAQARQREADKQVLVAEMGKTALAHELALGAYLDALTEHIAAHWKATGQPFSPPNPMVLLPQSSVA